MLNPLGLSGEPKDGAFTGQQYNRKKYVKNAICLNAISFLYLKKEIMI